MKENVEFNVTGFEEAQKAMSKTAKAFSELGKAIEQFQTARPTKGVKLKRWLARNLYLIIFSVMVFVLVGLHTFYGFYNLLLTFICGMISQVLLEKHKKRIAG